METREVQTPETYYTDTFGGYNANVRISESEFHDMRNMTSKYYPLLAVRDGRGTTGITGVYDFVPCDTSGTREGLKQGTVAAVTKDGTETYVSFLNRDGTDAKAARKIGGDAAETRLVAQAGYVYAFPQAVRIGAIKTEFTKLSNATKVYKNPAVTDEEVLGRYASFTLQPCDSEGLLDDSPLSSKTANKKYTGASGETYGRGTNEMVIITSTPPGGYNEYGINVYVDSSGIVTKVVSYTAEPSVTVPSGGFVLTGHGTAADWLAAYAIKGRYITVTGFTVKAYESAATAEVKTQKPDNPANGMRWRDTVTGKLYVWSAAYGQWMAQTQNYIYLSFYSTDSLIDGEYAYIGMRDGKRQTNLQGNYTVAPFDGYKEGDAITLEGFGDKYDSTYVISKVVSDAALILNGFTDEKVTRSVAGDTVLKTARKIPKLDFVIECNNRLWGCYYGPKDENDPAGEILNEIYCSALGDPMNWYKYEGTAMDSWTASVGAVGAWTGAAVYGGYPIFFKENAIVRVYGTSPSSFQLVTYNYRGIKPGGDKSVAVVDEVLYYHSYDGFMAYSGGVPVKVDAALGNDVYDDAVGGAYMGKYYVSARRGTEYLLLVYDTQIKLWHIEDNTNALKMMRCAEDFYILGSDGKIFTVSGGESGIKWYAETGSLGYGDIYYKRVNKIKIKLKLPRGSVMSAFVSYDDGEWESCGAYTGSDDMPIDIFFIPQRCDRYRLRFEGIGDCKIISVYRETEYAG